MDFDTCHDIRMRNRNTFRKSGFGFCLASIMKLYDQAHFDMSTAPSSYGWRALRCGMMTHGSWIKVHLLSSNFQFPLQPRALTRTEITHVVPTAVWRRAAILWCVSISQHIQFHRQPFTDPAFSWQWFHPQPNSPPLRVCLQIYPSSHTWPFHFCCKIWISAGHYYNFLIGMVLRSKQCQQFAHTIFWYSSLP